MRQGEMVNDSGTMTGGGGKPRGGRMRLGSAAPKQASDARSQAADLAAAEKQEAANLQVSQQPAIWPGPCFPLCWQ